MSTSRSCNHPSEAGRREVMHSRVSNEAPVGIVFDARQGHVRCRWHIWDIEPESDVCECGALNLVHRARIAKPEWEVRDLLR